MNEPSTRTLKVVLLEMAIYALFFAGYSYWMWYFAGLSLAGLFEPNGWLELANFLQTGKARLILILGLLILAVVFFALEIFSIELITLVLLIILVTTGILTPDEAFAGFGSDIIIILASIFVISNALQQTGVMDTVGTYLLQIAGGKPNRLLAILMAAVGSISMFMNNTTATAILIPSTMGLAHRLKLSPSKLLMPLAFASILGGTCTLIGTSTNVAVSGYIAQLGLEPLGLFELLPLGLILLGAGMLYMVTIGNFLLPEYQPDDLSRDKAIRKYLSEIIVGPNSKLIGHKIFQSDLAHRDIQILAVLRGARKFRPNVRSKVEAGDILLITGKVEELMKVKEIAGIEIKS
jgi:di/tricarboxylate transporter